MQCFVVEREALPDLGAKVIWQTVCTPKSEGGLGLKRLTDWNLVCQSRIVWLIFRGSDSFWIAWVKLNLLKGCSFWTAKAQPYHSCNLKKLLKFRDTFLPMIAFEVGDGKYIFLWHNPWHPKGPLLRHYGMAILYGSGSLMNAKLSTMIHHGDGNGLQPDQPAILTCNPFFLISTIRVRQIRLSGWAMAENG